MSKSLKEKYFDCCDRITLNKINQRKVTKSTQIYNELQEQIDKDTKLKPELEKRMKVKGMM